MVETKKTIVHVSFQDPSHLAGGQGVAVLNLCSAQVLLDCSVIWISPCVRDETPGEYYCEIQNGQISIIKIQFCGQRVATLYSTDETAQQHRHQFNTAVVNYIQKTFRPEEVSVHLHGFIDVPMAAERLIASGYAVVSTFHMFLSTRAKETGQPKEIVENLRRQEARAIASNNIIIVHSNGMKRDLRQICPAYFGQISVMPCGIGEENFTRSEVTRSCNPLVTTYGRISPEKGFDLFIESARIISEKRRKNGRQPIQFLVFGKTDESIANRLRFRDKIIELARDNPDIRLMLSPNGVWGKDRIKLIDRSWIGVTCSRYEPFGLQTAELMARGVPVVSTLTAGSKDIMETDQPGQTPYGIVTEHTAEDLADAIEFLVENQEQATQMGHNCTYKANRFFKVKDMAERTLELYHGTGDHNISCNKRPVEYLRTRIKFVEIHPTGQCNLACSWCTYREQNKTLQLTIEDLEILKEIEPEEILIAGGGEPTLFNNSGYDFNSLVKRIRELVPNARIRLITNGTIIRPGDWLREIAEVSISLDEATPLEFRKSKGIDAYQTVIRNIVTYLLSSPIPRVRVTMLYNHSRLHKAIGLAERLWKLYKKIQPENQFKDKIFCFKIFPLVNDRKPEKAYRTAQLSPEEKARWQRKLDRIKCVRPDFWRFIEKHTNLTSQPLAKLCAPKAQRCFPVTNYVLLGADGNFHPCFAMCAINPELNLGSTRQSVESLLQRRREFFANPPTDFCGRGCRPAATFYGCRALSFFVQQVRRQALESWAGMVNRNLASKSQRIGIGELEKQEDLSQTPGVVWLPDDIEYKVLDGVKPLTHIKGPYPPSMGQYLVQRNTSRGVSRGTADQANQENIDCPFCKVQKGFVLADLEELFGIPFILEADSRPFFPNHMLAIAKEHSAGRMSLAEFQDLVWLVNTVFTNMKANIGTGNQEDHVHCHLFEAELPIERLQPKWIISNPNLRVGLLENKLDLAYFVVESADINVLAGASHLLKREIECNNLLVCVLLAQHRVYIIPQVKKTISNKFEYPHTFDAFKEQDLRPKNLRARYVGPIEMAGIFLCYSRGDLEAMERMYEELNLDIFQHMLLETGLHLSDPLSRTLTRTCKVLLDEPNQILSLHDELAGNRKLAGGKSKGLYYLNQLLQDRKVNSDDEGVGRATERFRVPSGFVLSTIMFEQCVLTNKSVRKKLFTLKKLLTKYAQSQDSKQRAIIQRIHKVARKLRNAISKIEIPENMQKKLAVLQRVLGSDIAVRSSATVEDQAAISAAGLADSVLHVINLKSLIQAVKRVWASLYNIRFVMEFARCGMDISSMRMAVILQPMVLPRCGGVAMSVDKHGRPCICINAREGLGQAVVEGKPADCWFVSPDGNHILESWSRKSGSEGAQPCLTIPDIKQLATVVCAVRDYFRLRQSVPHVDIEFAFDKDGNIVLLQCRPVTTAKTTDEIHVKVIDTAHTQPCTTKIKLQGNCACEGASRGKLQILTGADEHKLIARVQAGAIVVTARTTSRWSAVLNTVNGIIAEEGGDMSHAAIHAREQNIPTLVNASNAIDTLRPYEGQIVTMDSSLNIVYIGEVPTKIEIRKMNIWKAGANSNGSRNDNADIAKHPNFVNDFEGNWFARPLIPYSRFQLDYYIGAFPKYVRMLEELEWPKEADYRPAIRPHRFKVKDQILLVELPDEGAQEADFMQSLSLEDFEFLIEQRWKRLTDIGEYIEKLDKLRADNVERVVNSLIELLAINSMGHELRTAFEKMYYRPQADYISSMYRPMMLKVAAELSGVPMRRDLTIEQQKELLAIHELFFSQDGAARLLNGMDLGSPKSLHEITTLERSYPNLFKKIEALSKLYKLETEDIRVTSETVEYLKRIREQLASSEPGTSIEQLASFCSCYVRAGSSSKVTLRTIMEADFDLYLAIRGYARATTGNIENGVLYQIIDEMREIINSQEQKVQTVQAALRNYPRLKKTLAIAYNESLFRNNFHHLITRYQRKVAGFMLEVARRHVELFSCCEDIFDIGIFDLVGLMQDEDPSYICKSFDWQQMLEEIETKLELNWKDGPTFAIQQYENQISPIEELLVKQAISTKVQKSTEYYMQVHQSLHRRAFELKKLAAQEQDKQGKQPLLVEA
jgi:glycosyltransferase involved in cell wall biosynthesis/phosphohistidine swiveling domain-containing protein/sulfatase maturation enzyme AslB (radical SAM superfamily)